MASGKIEIVGPYITVADASGNVTIRCHLAYTDFSQCENLDAFIAKHGGVDACADYLEEGSRNTKSWKMLLDAALKDNGESWSDVESNTMTETEMEKEFDPYRGAGLLEFTVWTKNSVYFPVGYDEKMEVGRVSRHPDGKPTMYQGGGC